MTPLIVFGAIFVGMTVGFILGFTVFCWFNSAPEIEPEEDAPDEHERHHC